MRFVVDASHRGRVLVSGPDAASFLHRMSTQHVKDLAVGDARLNVLTTDKGRIVDVVHHVALDEGVLLIGTRKRGAEVVSWLDRYFFTEKLSLADRDADTACAVVDVDTADALVPGTASLSAWQARRAGALVVVRSFPRADRDGTIVPAFLAVSLDAAASPLPAPVTDVGDDVCAAIAAGVPGLEIDERHTPLDLGLHDAIHWAKGCYIGQEVIARLDTYGKQRRQLLGLVVDPGLVAVDDTVVIGDTVVGAVTSVAPARWCPELPSALALVKRGDDAAGAVVRVRHGDGDVQARLVARAAAQLPKD